MVYQNEILSTYNVLLEKAVGILKESRALEEPYHFMQTYSPIQGNQTVTDGLLDELTPDEKNLYKKAYDLLRHKTPSNKNISTETVKTPQIDWMEKELNNTILNKEIRPIVCLGPKGSGKTTSLNYLISEVNRSFSEQKILMVRGNAEEYYKIKREFYLDKPAGWDIKEYMKHHTVNLFITHREEEPFKKILDEISEWDIKKNVIEENLAHPLRKLIRQGKRVTVKTLVEVLEDQCNLLNKSGFPFRETMITYELVKKVKYLALMNQETLFHTSWEILWTSLDEYFAMYNIKVFFVFDGLDNVWSFGDEEKDAYDKTIRDLADQLENYRGKLNHDQKYRFFYVVACRPESFQQLNAKMTTITNDECLFRFRSEKDTTISDNIIRSKFENLRAAVLEMKHLDHTKKGTGEFNAAIINNKFTDHVGHLAMRSGITEDDFFGGNVRGVIANFLSFAIFITFFSRELANGKMPPQVTEYHIFVRNLFFGGRRFVRTHKSTHEHQWKHSVIFPNVFHFSAESLSDAGVDASTLPNPLLCGVRLLDLLDSENLSPSDLIDTLVADFSYNKILVKNAIHLFLQFRLIEPVEPEAGLVCSKDVLHALPAARVLRYVLNHHIDIITYLAFDSVLPKKVAKWIFDGVKIESHDRKYLSNTVSVGLKFIAFLNALSSAEMGTPRLFPIDGYLKRTSYLLTELEKEHGKAGVLNFLESLTLK